MSRAKSIIITTAVAMVVNLAPLGEAIEAAARVNPLNLEDFPPLLDMSLRTDGGGVTCHYSNEKNMDGGPKSIKFRLERGSAAKTELVACPVWGKHFSFRGEFGFDSNVLKRFYSNFPRFNYLEAGQIYKFEDPPEPTGLDPLRNVSASAYSHVLESVSSAAKELEKPAGISGEWMPQDILFSMANGINTLREMREACSAALSIIRKQYPTFIKICDEYFRLSVKTVDTTLSAVTKGWRLEKNANVNTFRRSAGGRSSGEGVFGAFLHKFGF
ncbi:hypothetical protein FOZ61_005016 [Perkinsus olseni]|uniref:Uncharacterized protein n=2 Tax=Perkinsus olseni TaxID=32597 RepID=A0A7J6LIH6_PEROL|nr:hypothetical protein FOZ61_005016 [Perkinsus olseni]